MRGTRSGSVELERAGSGGGTLAYVGARGRSAGRRGESVAMDLVAQGQLRRALVGTLHGAPAIMAYPPLGRKSRTVRCCEDRAVSTAWQQH